MSNSYQLKEFDIITNEQPVYGSNNHYAIVEQTQYEDLLPFIYQLPAVPQWCYLFNDTDYEPNAGNGPILFEVESEEVMHLLAKQLETSPSGSFISSMHSFDDIQHQLQQSLTIRKQSGNHALSRFYDPRVLTGLLGTLSNDKIAQYLGQFTTIQWHSYSQWRQFTAINNPDKPSEQVSPFMIADDQIKNMDAIRQWEIKQHLINQYSEFVESPAIIGIALTDAENYGAQSARELESYLRLRVMDSSLNSEPEWMTNIMQTDKSFLSRVQLAQDNADLQDV